MKVAERVDFTIDLRRGVYLKQPLEAVATRFIQLAQQHADAYVSGTALKDLLQRGQDRLRTLLAAALGDAEELGHAGIEVVAVRVTAIRPKPEMEKAMEAPVREHVQQEADEAVFARRALAVEKERAIKENELKNQIELAKRDEELIAQKGQNERRQAQEKGEALRISAEAKASRSASKPTARRSLETLGKARAEEIHLVESAKVVIERERLAAQLSWEQGKVSASRPLSPTSCTPWPRNSSPESCRGLTTSASAPSSLAPCWPVSWTPGRRSWKRRGPRKCPAPRAPSS